MQSGSAEAPPRRPRRLRRWLLRGLLSLLALGLIKALWFARYRASAARDERTDLLARRAYLVHRVTAPQFGPRDVPAALGPQFQGEWALVSLSMTALALGGLSQRFPESAGSLPQELDQIAARALSPELHAFDTNRWGAPALSTLGTDAGHVGYLGHLALLLAVRELCVAGGPHRALLGQLSAALARKVRGGSCGLAETYPGETYFPDNAVALAALSLAAHAGVAAAGTASELLHTLHARYADANGLMPFRLGPGCTPVAPERSSGAAWNLMFLGLVEEAYVRRAYPTLRDRFLHRPLPGLSGLREWPHGDERGGDIDSGPLVLGLSPAGTGFALASAVRHHDVQTMQRLLDTAELAGSSIELAGRRRYLLAPLVGDAILLAARAPLTPR